MRARTVLTLFAFLLVLVGCGSAKPTYFYVLELPADRVQQARVSAVADFTVGVRTFAVDPPYDRDSLVYRVSDRPTAIGFYTYHRWAVPLERMLPVVVAAGLGDVSDAVRVEPDMKGRSYDAWIDGRVIAIEEIDSPDRVEVRLTLELVLRGPGGDGLWSHRAEGRKTVEARGANGAKSATEAKDVVEALNDLVASVVDEIKPALASELVKLERAGEKAR